MKRLALFFVVLMCGGILSAQTPLNDDCSGLIDLGPAPVCPSDTFSNSNATASNIGFDNVPSCFNGIPANDVWFSFICPDTLFDFRITLTGVTAGSIINPEIAIYRGDCTVDGLAELLCASADLNENSLFLDVTGLTPGVTYYLRINSYSPTGTPTTGNFNLCVNPVPPSSNVDDGGSTLCSGTLYDTGGPDGDYGPNEDHTFVICPNDLVSTGGCITFTLNYYNIEPGQGFGLPTDLLTFYDGPNVASPVITQIAGGGFGDPPPAAGGGVCFTVQATSGCLTVQFQSDATTQFEGWEANWSCSDGPCILPDALTVDTLIPNSAIVAAVSTPATTVTVTDINCPNQAYGVFSFPTDNNELGLDKGLILTSGQAAIAIGPNLLTGAGVQNAPFQFDTPPDQGDADLDYLSVQQGNGQPTYDACIVELDVFVATNELVFEYVFGSEEYPEYVNSNFNDIFAFLVSGPGIVGDPGLSNSAKNIAVLPDGNTLVQINSVNNLSNWQYYRNNEISQTLEYDGLTSDFLGVKKSLTARTEVIPCNTYHLKLAVADRGDESFDSGVFVSEIAGGTPDLKVQFASGIDYFIEDCSGTADQLIISLSDPLSDSTSFNVTVGGTATLGTDYLLNIPGVITFLPGQTQISFPISPIADNIMEGSETITISLSNNFGCGTVIYKTITIDLRDNVLVDVNGGDTLFVCAGGTLQLQATGAVDYFWSPPGAVSNPLIGDPTITPTQDIQLMVTGTVGTCVGMDTVWVKIISPTLDAVIVTEDSICLGASTQLQALNNTNNQGIVWTPANSLNTNQGANVTASPTQTTTYKATLSIAGCMLTDTVRVFVDTLFLPVLNFSDTTTCQNYPVQLAAPLVSSSHYEWSPASSLDNPNIASPLATPDISTVYTLTVSSANGICTQTASTTVNIIAADVDILGDSYREICLGDTVFLNANATPAGATINWSPSFALNTSVGNSVFSVPDESVTITARYVINNCVVFDSVFVRVDSLPLSVLRLEPVKDIYCPGDTVYILSPTYEPASFPAIEHAWEPFGGQLTPLDNWNLVITASITHTFIRNTSNRGCSLIDSIEVPVGIPPTLTLTALPPQVCPGTPSQITLTVDPPGTAVMWMPDPTLSCTDCLNPVATPGVTTQYSVSTPEADCPSGASITVEVLPEPALELPVNPVVCTGDVVPLNAAPLQPGVTYAWTSNPPGFISGIAQPVITPTQNVTVTVNASGPNFCERTETVQITVLSANLDAGPDMVICSGKPVQVQASVSGFQGGTITWSPGNQAGSNPIFSPNSTTNYVGTYTYGPDCVAEDDVLIEVKPGVNLGPIQVVPADKSICYGAPVTLELNVSPTDAALSWYLNNELLSGLNADSITLIPSSLDTSLLFAVVGINSEGCADTATVRITQETCFEMPNAFTPNGDGVNETYGPVFFGGEAEILEFLIFNRWGQKVFEATRSQTRWDGKTDGKEAPSDVYVFYIKIRYLNGFEEAPMKGEVTLLR